MSHDISVPNSQAIMGAVFIQYVFYAGTYIMEGTKYNELHPRSPGATSSDPAPANAGNRRSARNRANEEQKEGGD
jgi:hypothetical protein